MVCGSRRQDDYEVHAQTQSIILVFFTGWPTVQVAHAKGWEGFNDVAVPIMQHIVEQHYPPAGWCCAQFWRACRRVAQSTHMSIGTRPFPSRTGFMCRW